MPIKMKQFEDGLGFMYEGFGSVAVTDIIEANEEQMSVYKDAAPKTYFLGDYSKVETSHAPTEDIMKLAVQNEKIKKVMGYELLALIASDDLIFGLSRMWESHADTIDWETRVFRTRPEAVEWLKKTAKSRYNLEINPY